MRIFATNLQYPSIRTVMREKIDCFLPAVDEHFAQEIVSQLRNSKTIQHITLLETGLQSSNTLMQVAENAKADYVLLLTKPVKVSLGQGALDRMLRVASDSNAAMVYSDYISKKESEGKAITEKHPVIDYFPGSIRDDFDFGSLWLFKTSLLHTFAMQAGEHDYQYAGLYALRLFLSRKGQLFHINECLYTEEETDLRASGVKQFDFYLNPSNPAYKDNKLAFIAEVNGDKIQKDLVDAKNFAVGLRIEHPQEMISKSQYGEFYKLLPPASYKLVHQTKSGRGVYSFCMCPGGFVVNASSEKNRLVVNGMSNYDRGEINANSAIVVTVTKDDFGDDAMAGIEFQRKLEENAYRIGNGFIPVQLFKDYNNNVVSEKFGEVRPNTKGHYNFANLNEIFPEFINVAIKEAIPSFDKKIKGFGRADAILLGVESRTSSPVIIERDDSGISNVSGIYPCGEGAGYAGGITTAAIDGVKVAENICHKYSL